MALLLFTSGCATDITCDSYCLSRGGMCAYVENGHSQYNTGSKEATKRPTIYHCSFFN